jgi:hypothetical protein
LELELNWGSPLEVHKTVLELHNLYLEVLVMQVGVEVLGDFSEDLTNEY